MKVPISWLREYVDVPRDIPALAHRLTMAGIEVGTVSRIGGAWDNVFVAQLLDVQPHPNADRLRLATVDVGGERMTIVCGAPNLTVGDKIVFARVGASLVDGHTGKPAVLKPARIRGVESAGMCCSERELGLSEDHSQIIVLPPDAPVGAPLADYMGDTVLDLEVTANRPDCLSMLGIAWEVAAIGGGAVRSPDTSYTEAGAPIESLARVEIEAADLCPRYCAALVTGVKIGPSPRWMQDRLARAGMRPINNVVDVTNYVMLEYGQPLHAFDFLTLREGRVIVRRARSGERMTTLDGVDRPLDPEMLVIADAHRAVALAGVMGGADTEVSERTVDVLLESANFNNIALRRTARGLNMRSEASLRFEKGLSPDLPLPALRRATHLLTQICGGTAATGVIDVYPGKSPRAPLVLREYRVHQVLGVENMFWDKIAQVLSRLGFQCKRRGGGSDLMVTVPYWRMDISSEDDLAEEIARTIGYDQMPTTLNAGALPAYNPQPLRELSEQMRDALSALGMQEVITYSLVSLVALEKVGAASPAPLRVANPMSPDQEYLRTSLRPNLLATLASNERHEEGPIRLFEVGRVYLPRAKDLPEERTILIGVLCGPRSEPSWLTDPGPQGFYEAKGVLESLFARLGLAPAFVPAEDSLLHPGRSARLEFKGAAVGVLGEVHPAVLDRFDVRSRPVALWEIDLERLLPLLSTAPRKFRTVPRVPPAVRDMAVVIDAGVAAQQVLEAIQRHSLVAQATLVDVYAGAQVPPGKKSLACRITLQTSDRTLTAEEAQKALDDILKRLQREFAASLRT
ncbi:MAG: phenylalanine--tRNA ligase subunit beta [Dehalococcoidia bacterium]|nr:phenylalanine--tRNA ligase subunit beta [Dehalococcoidia bacterium]